MRIRPLIGSVVFNLLGAYRLVMDVLGDVDMIHTLTDKGSWLYAYGPILIGLILFAWAVWPKGLWPMSGTSFGKIHVEVQRPEGSKGSAIHVAGGSFTDNDVKIVVRGGGNGLTQSGQAEVSRNKLDVETGAPQSPPTDDARRKLFSGWTPSETDKPEG